MEGRYSIVPILKSTNIDPGDTIVMELFVSGHGQIKGNKLNILHPHKGILEKENPGRIITSIGTGFYENEISDTSAPQISPTAGGHVAEGEGPHNGPRSIDEYGTTVILTRGFFLDNPNWSQDGSFILPAIMSEATWSGYPPLRIKYNISEDAPPGDYRFNMIFSYLTGDVVKNSREGVEIHVNNRQERLEPIPTIAVMAGALIALLSLVIQAGIFPSLLDASQTIVESLYQQILDHWWIYWGVVNWY